MQKGITREDGGWRMGIILRLTADSTGTLAESMVQSLAPLHEVFIHQLGTTTPFTALPRSNFITDLLPYLGACELVWI